MKTNPVSFKSLLVFTIKDGKPKAPVPDLIRASFNNNDTLKQYGLDKDIAIFEEKIDGTVFNANSDFCQRLDKLYKNNLPKGSKRVMITQADFYVDPKNTEKRYFLTAATNEEENKILNFINKFGTLILALMILIIYVILKIKGKLKEN